MHACMAPRPPTQTTTAHCSTTLPPTLNVTHIRKKGLSHVRCYVVWYIVQIHFPAELGFHLLRRLVEFEMTLISCSPAFCFLRGLVSHTLPHSFQNCGCHCYLENEGQCRRGGGRRWRRIQLVVVRLRGKRKLGGQKGRKEGRMGPFFHGSLARSSTGGGEGRKKIGGGGGERGGERRSTKAPTTPASRSDGRTDGGRRIRPRRAASALALALGGAGEGGSGE